MTASLKCFSKSPPWGLVGWGPCLDMTILHQLDGDVEKLIADDDDEYNEDDNDKL